MADSKKYDGSQWEHSLRELITATESVENPLYSDGTSITAYTIKGNTVQNGTPTPSNPVDVQGVGERTENLFDKNDVLQGYRIGGDGLPFNDDWCALGGYIEVTPNTIVNQHRAFTFSNCMAEYDENKTFIIRYTSGSGIITTSASTKYIRVSVEKNRLDEAMVTMGATAPTSYEPYGYKIPISSASTTTPVYLGEVQTTRKIKKLVLDGSEAWTYESGYTRFYTTFPGSLIIGVRATPAFCTHYQVISDGRPITEVPNNSMYSNVDASAKVWFIKVTDYTTVADFKSYLAAQYAAGTPVTVWYVLATPETAAVNEPLMKIGDYADTLSNATSIPTTEGANSITVDTTVQPSEFTATWTGWHDSSVKEYDGSQWNE